MTGATFVAALASAADRAVSEMVTKRKMSCFNDGMYHPGVVQRDRASSLEVLSKFFFDDAINVFVMCDV